MSQQTPQTPRPSASGLPSSPVLWRAMLERDRRFDGTFYYGVASTRIYCRPGCPSRRPDPRHVRFFDTPGQAEAAGYRACRRCRPRDAESPDPGLARVIAACRWIEARDEGAPSLAELARAVHASPAHLHRLFKKVTGITPKQYADELRAQRLKTLLRQGEPVTGALYEAGYGAPSRLYEAAAGRLGMTPGTYRRGGPGERIRWAVVATALGPLLVAATERGICTTRLGETPAALEAELRLEFTDAELLPADGRVRAWMQALVDYLAGDAPWPELPLDVRASAFRARVWQALRAIPEGRTLTYGEIARAIGQPGAARAVGRACAENPAALAIPCHRAVPASGGPGAYRWGRERKRRLLALEAKRSESSPDE